MWYNLIVGECTMNDLELAYEKAFKLGDLQTCMQIAKMKHDFHIDLDKLSKVVIKSENPLFCACFVKWFNPLNKKPFENVIIKSGDAHIASIYACEHQDECDLKAFETIILERGDAYDCADFVCSIETDKHDEFKQKIIDEEEPYACYLYCLKFQPYGKELRPFQDIVIENGDMNTIYLFAKDIYDADVCALAKVAFDFGGSDDMINFACLVGQKYEEFYDIVFNESDVCDYIPETIIKKVDECSSLITRFEDSVVDYGSLEDVANFMLIVPYANCPRLQKIIEESNRKDLKLEIAMSDATDLSSLAKSICRDLKDERTL